MVGQGLLIIETSLSQSDTRRLLGRLWKGDQPEAENLPDNTQHSQQTDNHAPGGIQTRSPSKRAAGDPHLRRCGHWNWILISFIKP
jgi:hypothetical protein